MISLIHQCYIYLGSFQGKNPVDVINAQKQVKIDYWHVPDILKGAAVAF